MPPLHKYPSRPIAAITISLMNQILFCLLSLFFFSSTSCQNTDGLYDERNYNEVGRDTTVGYLKIYHYKYDTSYTMWKHYIDTIANDNGFWVKRFYHNDLKDGPYESYSNGRLREKGFYRNGKRDGDYIEYQDSGRVDIRGQYRMGKKVGIWEDYYSDGVIFKRVYYSMNGQFQKQEIYHRKTGKLARTEYEESRDY